MVSVSNWIEKYYASNTGKSMEKHEAETLKIYATSQENTDILPTHETQNG